MFVFFLESFGYGLTSLFCLSLPWAARTVWPETVSFMADLSPRGSG